MMTRMLSNSEAVSCKICDKLPILVYHGGNYWSLYCDGFTECFNSVHCFSKSVTPDVYIQEWNRNNKKGEFK